MSVTLKGGGYSVFYSTVFIMLIELRWKFRSPWYIQHHQRVLWKLCLLVIRQIYKSRLIGHHYHRLNFVNKETLDFPTSCGGTAQEDSAVLFPWPRSKEHHRKYREYGRFPGNAQHCVATKQRESHMICRLRIRWTKKERVCSPLGG